MSTSPKRECLRSGRSRSCRSSPTGNRRRTDAARKPRRLLRQVDIESAQRVRTPGVWTRPVRPDFRAQAPFDRDRQRGDCRKGCRYALEATAGVPRRTVCLTAAAEADFQEILRWTSVQFGQAQARVHAETLSVALNDLAAGPTVTGARERSDIAKGISTLHVARKGRKGRHFVMFRTGHDQGREVIEVLRLLHDAMDLQRHLPPTDESK